MLKMYCPEMREQAPAVYEAVARLAYDGRHYYVDTYYPLKGRGISYVGEASREGWSTYCVTEAAFQRLENKIRIVMRDLLD